MRTLGSAVLPCLSWPRRAQAQATVPVIGFFSSRSPEDSAELVTAFKRGLAEQGYVEGRNVTVEYRWARGKWDQLPAMAADLVRRPVDVIVAAGGEPATFAAKAATSTIPIVFGTGGDPVQLGIVESYNRPGGNATGTVLMTTDIEAKRLGVLHQLVPAAAMIAVLVNPNFPRSQSSLSQVEAAARTIGQAIEVFKASDPAELEVALRSLVQRRASALLVTADPFFDTQRTKIIALANQNRVPAIYQFREYAVAGGLLSYGVNIVEAYRQFGVYAGRILKGEKPADLPVVRSERFQLVLNLKTAREIGVTFPANLLALADEAIE